MNIELFVIIVGMIEILVGINYFLGILDRTVSVLFFGILIMTTPTSGESIIAHIFFFTVAACVMVRGAGLIRAEPILKYH
jgi:hypothetical protein